MSELLEKRVEKCEDKISELSLEVNENKMTVGFIKEIMVDLKNSISSIDKNTKETSTAMHGIHFKVDTLQKEVCDMKSKVEENEEFHKVDTRPIFKSVITKVLTGLLITGLGIGLLISLLT